MENSERQSIIVAICTYRRNRELEALLKKLIHLANTRWSGFDVGVTIIDDTSEGLARPVVLPFANRFAIGLVYDISGKQNISIARNMAIEGSLTRARWIAMTDDDCLPSDEWLNELIRVQVDTHAEVVTGLMLRRAPDHAPTWLKRQPFLQLGEFEAEDGDELSVAFTNNSLVSADFLQRNPGLRFDPDLGKIGGEDVTFFRAMKERGAKLVFSKKGVVFEKLPHSRMTYGYQLKRYFWHGNSSVITSMYNGKSRGRLSIHAAATLARAFLRPLRRFVRGDAPQLRFALAELFEGVGKMLGVLGVKIRHS